MHDYDLLVLGELNPDLVLGDDAEPVFGQVERTVASAQLVLGGSGAITACGAARLGLRVGYVGLAGGDPLADFVLAELARHGVDTRHVIRRPDERSGIGVVLNRPGGDRAILSYLGVIPAFTARDVPADALARARHVHVGAYFLQTGLHDGLPGLFAAHKRRGGTTSLDPNWDPGGRWDVGALLPTLDLLLPNAEEARRLTGRADVLAAATLLATAGPAVAVKLGAEGAVLVGRGATVGVPAVPDTRPVDTTGAGDSFDAGYLAGYLDGLDPATCLALGNACGSLSTRAAGGTAAQPTREEAEATAGPLVARATSAVDAPRMKGRP